MYTNSKQEKTKTIYVRMLMVLSECKCNYASTTAYYASTTAYYASTKVNKYLKITKMGKCMNRSQMRLLNYLNSRELYYDDSASFSTYFVSRKVDRYRV
jgi:hypothetical protein